MDKQQLPDYKMTFLNEMEELRQQQEQTDAFTQTQTPPEKIEKPIHNNIINTAQYSSSEWRGLLNQTSFRGNHDESHFQLNLLMNPEVGKKNHNIRSTQISQYSNAKHNNTVFINPKNTSC